MANVKFSTLQVIVGCFLSIVLSSNSIAQAPLNQEIGNHVSELSMGWDVPLKASKSEVLSKFAHYKIEPFPDPAKDKVFVDRILILGAEVFGISGQWNIEFDVLERVQFAFFFTTAPTDYKAYTKALASLKSELGAGHAVHKDGEYKWFWTDVKGKSSRLLTYNGNEFCYLKSSKPNPLKDSPSDPNFKMPSLPLPEDPSKWPTKLR